MKDKIEKVCPLCGAPRPPRAKRCICNYTFQYDRPSRPSLAVQGVRTPAQPSAFMGVALVTMILAFILLRGQAHLSKYANVGWLLVPVGMFAIAGAHYNWRWFMRNSRARRVSFFLGHTGARYFYSLLGGGMFGAGVAIVIAAP